MIMAWVRYNISDLYYKEHKFRDFAIIYAMIVILFLVVAIIIA